MDERTVRAAGDAVTGLATVSIAADDEGSKTLAQNVDAISSAGEAAVKSDVASQISTARIKGHKLLEESKAIARENEKLRIQSKEFSANMAKLTEILGKRKAAEEQK